MIPVIDQNVKSRLLASRTASDFNGHRWPGSGAATPQQNHHPLFGIGGEAQSLSNRPFFALRISKWKKDQFWTCASTQAPISSSWKKYLF
jgi:hypothetical protein